LYKNPHALRFWKELIRSRLDDLAAEEFQMGIMVRNGEEGDGESGWCSEGEEGDAESLSDSVPEGYTGGQLFMDATGQAQAPPALEDLQDSIDALRSSLDMIAMLPAFVGRPYGELVISLLSIGVVAMGLYRPGGQMEATMPFSLVNPPASMRLVRGDLVYILRPGPLFGDRERGRQAPPGQPRRESSAPPASAPSAEGGAGSGSSAGPTVFRSPPPPPPSRYRPGLAP
jgi:hypothetical protein